MSADRADCRHKLCYTIGEVTQRFVDNLKSAASQLFPTDFSFLGISLSRGAPGGLAWFLFEWHQAYLALVVLMALDLASAVVRAAIRGKLSSVRAQQGILKKVMILIVVGAIRTVGVSVGMPVDLGVVTACAFCLSELISILENAVAAGVPVPKQIIRLIEVLDPNAQRKIGNGN